MQDGQKGESAWEGHTVSWHCLNVNRQIPHDYNRITFHSRGNEGGMTPPGHIERKGRGMTECQEERFPSPIPVIL